MSMLLAAAGLVACASGKSVERQRLGDIRLVQYGNPSATPIVLSVQTGRIVSPDVDLAVDPDGCIRGRVPGGDIEVCSKTPPPPLAPGEHVELWSGNGGNFTVELTNGGNDLRADGFLRPTGGLTIPMNATIPLGQGPQWDELRGHPALLAIAAAAYGIRGEPNQQARDTITR
jgi:hypothetical protein